MKKWFLIFSSASLILSLLLLVNETLLIKSKHLKSVVSDEDLWSAHRDRISELDSNDIILIGASRMQVNIDLEVMENCFPGSKILQLALSGSGSSRVVLNDIVDNTDFAGIILIDESQASLSNNKSKQEEFVDYFHSSFSPDKRINGAIGEWLQTQFRFLNPNSNSERLWGNILGKRKLPPPMHTLTYPTREQTSFFDLTDTKWIYKNNINGVKSKVKKKSPQSLATWLTKVEKWRPLLDNFKSKGGKTVLIHMPFSHERWLLENEWMPKQKYWDSAIKKLKVHSIHFADYTSLQKYRLPDTSHIDAEDKKEFTENLASIIKRIFDK